MKFLKAERESLRKAGEEILKSTEELIKGTEDLLAKDKSATVCYNPKRKTTPEDNEVK